MTTRVLITGARDWPCHDVALAVVGRLAAKYGEALVVVHGAAPGVDRAFQNACHRWRVAEEPHPADWERSGRGAGPKRNREMVAAGAELCIAVHRDLAGSKGTRDCVGRALEAGIPTYLIESEEVDADGRHRVRRLDRRAAGATKGGLP